jgi:hypothetical protein
MDSHELGLLTRDRERAPSVQLGDPVSVVSESE